VLGNLAMMSLDPDAVPTHINIRDGSTQVQDNGVLSSASPASIYPSLSGSRTIVAQWTLIPVTDDLELTILRLAYRRALGFDEELDIDLANDLAHELCNRVSNSDYVDLRSDPNINVEMLQAASLFDSLAKALPGEAALPALLKPRTNEPDVRWLPSLHAEMANPPRDPANFIIVAVEGNVLRIRVCCDGALFDTDEKLLAGKAPQIDALKQHLARLVQKKLESSKPLYELTADEEAVLKFLLEPIVGAYFANQFNRHADYYNKLLEVFNPILLRLNGLATARLQLNITSNDDNLLYADELKPGFGRKVDAKFIKSLDTAIYVGKTSDGKTYPYGASPVVREARRQVRDFYVDLLDVRSGWFSVGSKRDVPRDACYVGRFRNQYAWVSAAGRKELADFTIKILNFATLIKEQTITAVPGGPRFTPSVPSR
jgi:hypothetical protein